MRFLSRFNSVKDLRLLQRSSGMKTMLFFERSNFSSLTRVLLKRDLGISVNLLESIFTAFKVEGRFGRDGPTIFLSPSNSTPSLLLLNERFVSFSNLESGTSEPLTSKLESQFKDLIPESTPNWFGRRFNLLLDKSNVRKLASLQKEKIGV